MFTMVRIKATRGKGKDFFLKHLSCNDYYSEKERIIGTWNGRLADMFGLSESKVDSETFSLFQQNINPRTHGKLTQRTVNGGIRFYDFQCSAQKSVSIMSIFDERLVDAHRRSVALAMNELEKFASVRIRNGENVNTQNHETTGKIIYAAFHHDTSRALDPQLHTHNVVCNVTVDSDEKFKALENSEMCRAIRYCGRVYQNALASECRKLGYDIAETVDFRGNVKGFEIQGVPEDLLDRFSKRSLAIDEKISRQEYQIGRTLTAAEKHEIALDTRDRKMLESDSTSVRAEQLLQLSSQERMGLEELVKDTEWRPPLQENQVADQAVEEVLPEVFERVSVLKENQILAEILTRNLGRFSLEQIKKALSRNPSLKYLAGDYVTTSFVMDAEQYAIDAVERERDLYEPLNAEFVPFAQQNGYEVQREIIQGILRSRDRFTLLRGAAGSGKTSVLKELARGLDSAPLVLAPTNSAANVLKSEGFPHSQTVASFLLNPPDFSGLVIVDESGLNSLRDGVKLLHLAEEKQFRILFVGDSRQHNSVDCGDFFRLLEEHSNIARFELKEIHRQQIEEYRKGVQECADGHFQFAFSRFDQAGYLHENHADYLKEAAEKYIQLLKTGQVIAVAPTHKECDALTAEIRKRLPPSKTVATKEIFRSAQLTKAKLRNPKTYKIGQQIMFVRRMKGIAEAGTTASIVGVQGKQLHLSGGKIIPLSRAADFIEVGELRSIELREGDVIQFHVNLRDQRIYNGNLARITDSPGIIELLNSDMESIRNGLRQLPENFSGFDYGWVMTSHKSQGRTAQHVVVAAQKLDRRAFYVACSRGRKSLDLYCPDKLFLKNQLIRRSDDRLNAADIQPSLPKKEYLKSSETEVAEWNRKYQEANAEYERKLAEFQKQKNELESQLNTLMEEYRKLEEKTKDLPEIKNEFDRYLELPLLKRMQLKILGKVPLNPKQFKADEMRRRELVPLCNILESKIRSLEKPELTMPKRRPLSFGERLANWIKHKLFPRRSRISEADRRLIVFAKSPSEENLIHWYSAKGFFDPDILCSVYPKIVYGNMRHLFHEPQSESQYKCFRRTERELSSIIDEAYSAQEKQIEEQERKENERLYRLYEQRRERLEQESRRIAEKIRMEQERQRQEQERRQHELDILNEERRRNPMSDNQKKCLENLFAQGKIDHVPQELSSREATQMIATALEDDPLTPQQREILQKKVRKGLLEFISDADMDLLTQKDYSTLIKQSHKQESVRFELDRNKKAFEQKKSKGMDL